MLKTSSKTLRNVIFKRVDRTGSSEKSSLDPFINHGAAGLDVVAKPNGARPALWTHGGLSDGGQENGSQWSVAIGSDGAIGPGTAVGILGLAETTRRGQRDSGNRARTDGGLVGSYVRREIGSGEAVLFGGMGRFATSSATLFDEGRRQTSYDTDRLVWSGAVTQTQTLGAMAITQSAEMTRLNSGAELPGPAALAGERVVEVGSFRASLEFALPERRTKPRLQMSLERSSLDIPAPDNGDADQFKIREDRLGVSVAMDLEPAPRSSGWVSASLNSTSGGDKWIGLNLAIRY